MGATKVKLARGRKAAVRGAILAATMFALGAAKVPADAATLREALLKAYAGNPTLTGARAGQRAIDETVAIAKASGRPFADTSGSYSEFVRRGINGSLQPARAASGALSVNIPIYQGGAVRNSIRAADARIEAGRASLRSTEANVFTQTVSAYMDVIRDLAIVELNRGNVRVLQTNLRASSDRFEVGDLTRTDVAQSQARLRTAESQLQSALAQLDSSRETYLQLVGEAATDLEPPPPLPPFPKTPDAAAEIAVDNNPDLIAARASARAAARDVDVIRASRLPTLSAFGQGNYVDYLGSSPDQLVSTANGSAVIAARQSQFTSTVGLQATLPLYQGGLPAARIRQAQARSSQAIEQIAAIERSVVADSRATYSIYAASLGVIASSEGAAAANELALEGVRAENSVGLRNVLDVLNAEQELLNSRVQLVTARRDAYVAGFALLAALGRAEARDLGLDGGALYDPAVYARRVRNAIGDWSDGPAPQPIATSTVGVPAPTTVVLPASTYGPTIPAAPTGPAATRPAATPPAATRPAPTPPAPAQSPVTASPN